MWRASCFYLYLQTHTPLFQLNLVIFGTELNRSWCLDGLRGGTVCQIKLEPTCLLGSLWRRLTSSQRKTQIGAVLITLLLTRKENKDFSAAQGDGHRLVLPHISVACLLLDVTFSLPQPHPAVTSAAFSKSILREKNPPQLFFFF